jgi:hypothetical protein
MLRRITQICPLIPVLVKIRSQNEHCTRKPADLSVAISPYIFGSKHFLTSVVAKGNAQTLLHDLHSYSFLCFFCCLLYSRASFYLVIYLFFFHFFNYSSFCCLTGYFAGSLRKVFPQVTQTFVPIFSVEKKSIYEPIITNSLKSGVHLRNVSKFSSRLTENSLLHIFKDQLILLCR